MMAQSRDARSVDFSAHVRGKFRVLPNYRLHTAAVVPLNLLLFMILERASAVSLVRAPFGRREGFPSGGVRGSDATAILSATHFEERKTQNRRLDGTGILVAAVLCNKRPLGSLIRSARCPRKASYGQHLLEAEAINPRQYELTYNP